MTEIKWGGGFSRRAVEEMCGIQGERRRSFERRGRAGRGGEEGEQRGTIGGLEVRLEGKKVGREECCIGRGNRKLRKKFEERPNMFSWFSANFNKIELW